MGFVAAAAVVGVLAGPRAGLGRLLLAMTAGVAVVHLFGLLHLSLFLGRGPWQAMQDGLRPVLLVGTVLKVAGAATLVAAWRGLGRR